MKLRLLGLLLILSANFAMANKVEACSLSPSTDYHTGKKFAYYNYSRPNTPNDFRFDFQFKKNVTAVVRANVVSREIKKYRQYDKSQEFIEQTIRFDVVELILGEIDSSQSHKFPFDERMENVDIKEVKFNFHFWENIRLPEHKTFVNTFPDSCGNSDPKRAIFDQKLYLALGHQYESGEQWFEYLVPINRSDDELVDAIRKISLNKPSAPNKFYAKNYFSHMKGYSDINILECPSRPDFLYEDSRFVGPERQAGNLYGLSDQFNSKSVEFKDVMAYNGSWYPEDFKCNFGDRYLVIRSPYPKFLKVEQGRIDTSDIVTNIDILGPNLIAVEQVKTWIRDGNSKGQ